MIKQYTQTREAIPKLGIREIHDMRLKSDEVTKIHSLYAKLKQLDFVTVKLQNNLTSVCTVSVVFDAVLKAFPRFSK